MCGLVGYISKEKINNIDLLYLLQENDSRGGHSTGFYNGSDFFKCIGASDNLFPEIRKNSSDLIIGHTRYATHGKHTLENQHPFQYGNIIGAHNGVISNYEEVGDKYGIDKTVVDSQMIFKVLNHTQDVQTLGLFSGTLATLFSNGDGHMYAYRKGNPLYVGKILNNDSYKGNTIYFSSLEYSLKELECDVVYQLKEGILYKFNEYGNVVDKITIESNEIPARKVISTDWKSYNNNYAQKEMEYLFAEEVSYNKSYNVNDEPDITYVEILHSSVSEVVEKLQSNLNENDKHVLDEVLEYMQDKIWESYQNEY